MLYLLSLWASFSHPLKYTYPWILECFSWSQFHRMLWMQQKRMQEAWEMLGQNSSSALSPVLLLFMCTEVSRHHRLYGVYYTREYSVFLKQVLVVSTNNPLGFETWNTTIGQCCSPQPSLFSPHQWFSEQYCHGKWIISPHYHKENANRYYYTLLVFEIVFDIWLINSFLQ